MANPKSEFFIPLAVNTLINTGIAIVLKSEIDDALDDVEEDEHVKEGIELIRKICKIVEEKKRKFVRVSNDEVQRVAHKFIQKGDDVRALVKKALHLLMMTYKALPNLYKTNYARA